jgi:hypothetical protein
MIEVPCTLVKALMSNERIESFDVILVKPFRHPSFIGSNRLPTGKKHGGAYKLNCLMFNDLSLF